MRSFRALSHAIFVVVVVALGVLRLDIGAFAQVEALSATPPLIEEVSRLVSKHFYDRETVERVWAQARAAHTAALPPDATSEEVAAALDAMLDDLGASHTEHYLPGELAYYELLDVFARDEFAPRLRTLFPKGQIAYTGIGVVPRTLEGRVFLAAVYHGGPAERAGLLVGDEIVSADGEPFDPINSFENKAGEPVRLEVRRVEAGPTFPVEVVPRRIRAERILPQRDARKRARRRARRSALGLRPGLVLCTTPVSPPPH